MSEIKHNYNVTILTDANVDTESIRLKINNLIMSELIDVNIAFVDHANKVKQTYCARCSKLKETPLRIDEMDGYVCLTCIIKELDRLYKENNDLKNIKESCYKAVDKYGTERWYNKDEKLHRDNDLPAVIYSDGSKFWYQNGERHRDNNLPAIINANGYQAWYKNGVFIKYIS
jgi:predicted ATP-binding protein involved in virulence